MTLLGNPAAAKSLNATLGGLLLTEARVGDEIVAHNELAPGAQHGSGLAKKLGGVRSVHEGLHAESQVRRAQISEYGPRY